MGSTLDELRAEGRHGEHLNRHFKQERLFANETTDEAVARPIFFCVALLVPETSFWFSFCFKWATRLWAGSDGRGSQGGAGLVDNLLGRWLRVRPQLQLIVTTTRTTLGPLFRWTDGWGKASRRFRWPMQLVLALNVNNDDDDNDNGGGHEASQTATEVVVVVVADDVAFSMAAFEFLVGFHCWCGCWSGARRANRPNGRGSNSSAAACKACTEFAAVELAGWLADVVVLVGPNGVAVAAKRALKE